MRQPEKSATTFFVGRPFKENACVAWVIGVPIRIAINCTKMHRTNGRFLVLLVVGERPLDARRTIQMHHKLAPVIDKLAQILVHTTVPMNVPAELYLSSTHSHVGMLMLGAHYYYGRRQASGVRDHWWVFLLSPTMKKKKLNASATQRRRLSSVSPGGASIRRKITNSLFLLFAATVLHFDRTFRLRFRSHAISTIFDRTEFRRHFSLLFIHEYWILSK